MALPAQADNANKIGGIINRTSGDGGGGGGADCYSGESFVVNLLFADLS